jgi:DNA-binding NtrC family response regulator
MLIIGPGSGELAQAGRLAAAAGAKVSHAAGIDDALDHLRRDGRITLVLCDITIDIAALSASMHAERIVVPIVACGIDIDVDSANNAIRYGAANVLPLPPEAELIAAMLRAASGDTHQLIVRDVRMRQVVNLAERVAKSNASILIDGESGTGKEVMARHIHAISPRAAGPFVALNCAALPETLLESELFGHEKGAFSGALARRVGKFEAAHGGTLLLDEISEMDIRLQAKLLRAIQEKEIDRLGGSSPVRLNVRILAATNRDLPAEIAAGRFREDLYFRLNVVSLRIPPLRERRDDIAPLATHFLRHYAEVNGLPFRILGREALDLLQRHHWRGNVRELENCMHRAVLLSTAEAIASDVIELADPERGQVALMRADSQGSGFAERRLDEIERELILSTLSHTLGNRTQAAAILGISIRSLRNKIREYASKGLEITPPQSGIAA